MYVLGGDVPQTYMLQRSGLGAASSGIDGCGISCRLQLGSVDWLSVVSRKLKSSHDTRANKTTEHAYVRLVPVK